MVLPNTITPRNVDNVTTDIRTALPVLRQTDPLFIATRNMAGYLVLWELDLYNRQRRIFIDFATGTSLDAIGSEYEVMREAGEEDSVYRIRIKAHINSAGSAGTREAYIAAATDVPGVEAASVFANVAQQRVDIYIVPETGTASSTLVNTADAFIEAHPRRAVLDVINVIAATPRTITIQGNIIYPRGEDADRARREYSTNLMEVEALARIPGRTLTLNEVITFLSRGGFSPAVSVFSETTTGVETRLTHSQATPPESEFYTIRESFNFIPDM